MPGWAAAVCDIPREFEHSSSTRTRPVSTNVEITIAPPRFSAKTDILLVLRDRGRVGERSQVAGARLSVKTVDCPGAKQGRGNVIFTLILWITIKSDGDLELSCSKQQKKIGQKMLTFIMEKYFSKKMKWNLAGLNCQ